MKQDPTYGAERRVIQAKINARRADRKTLESIYGQVWDTNELQRDFYVRSFLAPFVSVTRKSDAASGWMMFQHYPRFYWGFEANEK